MAKIEIDITEYCPALVDGKYKKLSERGFGGKVIAFDSSRESKGWVFCKWGGGAPDALLEGDRMVQVFGQVELSCGGCKYWPEGFADVLRKKIR